MKDSELLKRIKMGGLQRELAIQFLIKRNLRLIKIAIRKHKIPEEDAQEAFHDGLLATIKNIEENKYQGKSSINTYFKSIYNFKVIDRLRQTKIQTINLSQELVEEFQHTIQHDHNPLSQLIQAEKMEAIQKGLLKLSEKCRQILTDFFWGRFSMEEIAKKQHLKDAKSAKQQKYRCLQNLRKIVQL